MENQNIQNQNGFDEWAVLELFGHQRIAGRVTEASIGGGSFIRVEVPGPNGEPVWTRFYNPSSVYSISPVSKEVAISVAIQVAKPPVSLWELKALKQLPQKEEQKIFDSFYDDDDDDLMDER